MAWEQGQELPVGFTKKVIGFPRVANNCAVCHTVSYRLAENENPRFVTAGPAHTNVEAYFRFLVDCGKDPRFNPDVLMREIELVTDLSWVERLIYRFLLIPITKKRLTEREEQFKWIYRSDFPDWGRGRDDAMNLTKYFMIQLAMDDTFGPTDMPSIWNLKKYDRKGTTLNWAGDSHDAYSVVLDSALGLLGAPPHDKQEFLGQVDWLLQYLRDKPPPRFPLPIDATKAEAGRAVFDRECAACHASDKTGARLPLVGGQYRSRAARILEQAGRHCGQQGRAGHGHRAPRPGGGVARGLQRGVPGRDLAAGSLPSQRVGADVARPA